MANIALDIKANTQKALGEFKKLSRELDNKFLVQGLKLDVVKNAFTQINREFENAVGTQGLRAAESSGQLQRSLALNLTTFKRFGRETAEVVSKDVLNSLQQLRAEGTITGKVLQDSLSIASFLDFDAAGPELQRKLREGTNTIAKFVQQTSDLFGGSEGQLIQRALTGEISVDEFFKVSTGRGGATNKFRDVFRKYQDALKNADPTIRTQGILAAIQEIQSDPAYRNTFRSIKPIESVFREISGLFSEKGLFGALRPVGDQIRNFDNQNVDRNLLQVTGKLLRTIFDREEGVFAKLNKALQRAFGNFDVLEPILAGVTFLTEIFEKLGNFFESSEFRSFLNIFDSFVAGVKGIFSGGGLNFSVDSINGLIDGIFDAIKGLINKVAEFIGGLDAGAIGSVLGNIIEELLGTIGPLLNLAFKTLGKSLEVAFSNLTTGIVTSIVGALVGTSILDKLLGGVGLRGEAGKGLRRLFGGGQGIRGFIPGQGRNRPQFDRVSGERLDGFQSAVLDYMRDIIGALTGRRPQQGDMRDRRGRVRRYTQGRDGRSIRQRALDMRRLRRGGGLGSRLSRFNLLRNIPTGVPGLSSFSTPQGASVGRLGSDYRNSRNMFSGRRIPFSSPAGVPGLTPESIGFRAPQIPRPIPRITPPPASGGLLSRLGGGLRGGLRRIPLLGTLFSGLAIASILGGPGANASEMEGLSPEEQREQRRAERREKTRGVLGVIGGIAGGAAGGAALGTVIGGPIGTLIGGVIGGIVGEEAIKLLSDPIIDGIGSLASQLGEALGGIWDNVAGLAQGGFKNFMNFFGPEGPIQSLSRFVFELPGNIIDTIKEGFSSAYDGLKDLGGNIVNTLAGLFGGGRFLGGVGSGLTLVGENGPELVNLGSGAIVIPNSSLSGNLYGEGGSSSSVNNYVTVNVNAPGADEFAQQLSDAVIVELNTQFDRISAG